MKIILKGDFYDCQIIRGRVFLWNTWGQLFVYDIRENLKECIEKTKGQDAVLVIQNGVLDKFLVATVNVKGGIYPLDSAFMGNHLYTSTETGLFKRYIQTGKGMYDFSKGKAMPIFRVPFYNIAVGDNYMALAGKEEGVFELFNDKRYRISKDGHPVKMVANGLYSVNRSYSNHVWYDDKNIISKDDSGQSYLFQYRVSLKSDNVGRYLRTYLKRSENELTITSGIRMLPSFESVKLEGKRRIEDQEFLRQDMSKKRTQSLNTSRMEYRFIADGYNKAIISIGSKPRRNFKAGYGVVVESKKEVVIVKSDGNVIRIPGPITRARNVKDSFGKDYLTVVLNDSVIIDDLKNIKNDY